MSDPAPDLLARIYDYLDEEMDPDERAAFEAELAADPALAEEFESARAAMQTIHSAVSEVRAPDDFERAVQRRIRRRSRGRYFARPGLHPRTASLLFPLIALGILIIIALILGPGRIELLMDEEGHRPTPEESAPDNAPPDGSTPDGAAPGGAAPGEPGAPPTGARPDYAEGRRSAMDGAQPAPPAARGRVPHPPSDRPAEVLPLSRVEFRYTIHSELDAAALRQQLRQRVPRDSLEEVRPGTFDVRVRRSDHTEAVMRLSELGRVERARQEVDWEERIPIRVVAAP